MLGQGRFKAVTPFFSESAVPVVFCSDEAYAPYLGVSLQSLVNASSPAHNYDIIVMHSGLSGTSQALLSGQVASRPNFSLRFYDMADICLRFGVAAWFSYPLSAAAYFRLFIPLVFREYAKVLYLDSDTLVREDVARLYSLALGDNLLAAARDYGDLYLEQGTLEYNGKKMACAAYLCDVLRLEKSGDYFNSGVLLWNITAMNRRAIIREFSVFASKHLAMYDQDVLNAVCQGKVLFLEPEWNGQWHVLMVRGTSSRSLEECGEILARAKILHYVHLKPNAVPDLPLGHPWLECARGTPFYARIMGEEKECASL